jgi:hypothetical protein
LIGDVRVKGFGIEAGVFDSPFVREFYRQEQRLVQEDDGADFGDLVWKVFGRSQRYL